MSNLAAVIPLPIPITLGGQRWMAGEFTLHDVAILGSYAAAAIPSPYEEHAFELTHRPRGREWKQLLARVIEDQQHYPPDSDQFLMTAEGQVHEIHLCLRKHTVGFDLDDARRLHERASAHPITCRIELDRLRRVAWGADPMESLTRMIDGPNDDGSPISWGQVYHEYLTQVHNGPPFGELTISQLRAWRLRGVEADGTVTDRANWQEIARRRAEFWGDVD